MQFSCCALFGILTALFNSMAIIRSSVFNYITYRAFALSIILSVAQPLWADAPGCYKAHEKTKVVLSQEQLSGAQFLHQRNNQLHTSKPVELTKRQYRQSHQTAPKSPQEKLHYWLQALESRYAKHQDNPQVIAKIKAYYLGQGVIKRSEVPESYFDFQVKLAKEQGHGDIVLSEFQKNDLANIVIKDQKKSLETWLDYFLSADASSYPMWTKHWAYMGLLKLAKYNKETGTFGNRSKGQIAPYPELNREAFAMVIDAIVRHANKKSLDEITDPVFIEMLKDGSFGKLYGRAIYNLKTVKQDLTRTDGVWIKYDQNSDPTPLVNSLNGKNTGWCTSGFTTAESQLKSGDFYVYYSKNQMGKPTTPRLAIRMNGNREIAEVRGIAENQNMDTEIVKTTILKDKLSEFGSEGERYNKKSSDMKILTKIYEQYQQGLALSKADLRFLYELDNKIEGFGYEKDPRIAEILNGRNVKADLAFILDGIKEHEISLTTEEVLNGGIKYHYGDLLLNSVTSVKDLSIKELVLPTTINGSLHLNSLKSAEGLKLPEAVNGDLILHSLKSTEGLTLPKSVNGSLSLYSLISAEGLTLPKSINGNLYLDALVSAEGLKLPEFINGDLSLYSLKSAKGLTLPKSISGDLSFFSLLSIEGLILPTTLNGNLNLYSLTSAEGLTLPVIFKGKLNLKNK